MAHGCGGAGGAGKNATAMLSSSTTPSTSSSFAHTKPATALAWHSGSASLLSASKDGTVACWDVRSSGRAGGGGSVPSAPPALRLHAREPLHSVCFLEESLSLPSSTPSPSAATTSASALVAAGGDGKIFLWDARTGRELAVLSETHEGDVSALVRAPVRPTVRADDGSLRAVGSGGSGCFLSAGVDGLVAVWDVNLSGALSAAAATAAVPSPSSPNDNDDDEAKTLEDEAFVTALNTNTSVSRMGLCCCSSSSPLSPSLESSSSSSLHLWATTGVEGLLTWDWGAACDERDAAGGVGPSSLVDDARSGLLRASGEEKAGKKGPSGSLSSSSSSCDYVVGCVAVSNVAASSSSSSSSVLLLAAGDHAGRLALFPLGPPAARGGAPTLLGPASSMAVPAGTNASTGKPYRGHSATVRALAAVETGSFPLLATGGEDGLVVLWAPGGGGPGGSGGFGGFGGSGVVGSEASDDAQRDFSRLGVSAVADGVTKKKKKRRHRPQKKNKGGGGDGNGGGGGGSAGGAAVDMAVE